MDWNKVSFVVSGKRRTSIVLSLYEKPKTIEELTKESKTTKTNVTIALKSLVKEGIVSFEIRKGEKICRLTRIGREIAKNVRLTSLRINSSLV